MPHVSPIYAELFKREDAFYCRLNVPEWLERRSRRKVLKFSLRTKDVDVALYRRNLVADAFAAFFFTIDTQHPDINWLTFREAYSCFIKHLAGDIKWLGMETVNHGNGRGGGIRTHDTRFWRPVLYQLSYTPVIKQIS